MGGTRPLTCAGFVESPTFEKSKYDLIGETGLTSRQIDNRLEALVWALARVGDENEAGSDASAWAELMGRRDSARDTAPTRLPAAQARCSRAMRMALDRAP